MAVSDDDGWEIALDHMTDLLTSDQEFCHIRFGDGELNAACGIYDGRPNCDGVVYNDQIAAQMRRVFEEMRSKSHDRYIPGGTCVADRRHAEYLKSIGYTFGDHPFRPNGWVPCHVIVAGVEGLRTMPMLQRLKYLGRESRLYLAGAKRLEGVIDSRLLEVGPKGIQDLKTVAEQVSSLPSKSVVMYCAGTPGKVMAWDGWNARPDVTHLDMGHFFDRACGWNNRMWHDADCKRRDDYDKYFTPLLRSAH